jgi:hypothetical protein
MHSGFSILCCIISTYSHSFTLQVYWNVFCSNSVQTNFKPSFPKTGADGHSTLHYSGDNFSLHVCISALRCMQPPPIKQSFNKKTCHYVTTVLRARMNTYLLSQAWRFHSCWFFFPNTCITCTLQKNLWSKYSGLRVTYIHQGKTEYNRNGLFFQVTAGLCWQLSHSITCQQIM